MTEDWRPGVSWWYLHEPVLGAVSRACAPYFGYPVKAVTFVDDGRPISGYDVRNAGCEMILCVECELISELVHGGGGRLLAFVRVNADAETVVPCGRCKQLLVEHADPAMVLDMPGGLIPVAEALPFVFGLGDLNVVERTAPFMSKEN